MLELIPLIQWLLYDCRIDSRARKDPIRYKAEENGIAARNTSEYVTCANILFYFKVDISYIFLLLVIHIVTCKRKDL